MNGEKVRLVSKGQKGWSGQRLQLKGYWIQQKTSLQLINNKLWVNASPAALWGCNPHRRENKTLNVLLFFSSHSKVSVISLSHVRSMRVLRDVRGSLQVWGNTAAYVKKVVSILLWLQRKLYNANANVMSLLAKHTKTSNCWLSSCTVGNAGARLWQRKRIIQYLYNIQYLFCCIILSS